MLPNFSLQPTPFEDVTAAALAASPGTFLPTEPADSDQEGNFGDGVPTPAGPDAESVEVPLVQSEIEQAVASQLLRSQQPSR